MDRAIPLLRCLAEEKVDLVGADVYEGVCVSHIGGKILASKLSRVKYYFTDAYRHFVICK